MDPHIKASEDYFVYANGMELQDADQPNDNLTNIFVRNSDLSVFYGICWPGNSSYLDILNENA